MDKRLYRSEHDRVLFGVCGGFGDYFKVDPVLIRVIAVILTVITGVFPGLVAYLIIALIIPSESSTAVTPGDSFRENVNDMKETTASRGEEMLSMFNGGKDQAGSAQDSSTGTPARRPSTSSNSALYVLGIVIIVLGIFFILSNIFGWFWTYLWPFLLILAGVLIIVAVARRK